VLISRRRTIRRLAYRYDSALELVARGQALAVIPADRSALARQFAELLLERGAIAEAAAAYDVALPLAAGEDERARALLGRAAVKRLTDDLAGAFADLNAADEIAGRLAMDEAAARIHILRGNLLFPRGDIAGCLSEHQHGLKLARRAGARRMPRHRGMG
jgi:hypothetical protein